ncbi:hypothetical protein [Streptomyces sp. NPDC001568]|uniref:hypothetical protein n=1 Tax=Streptomyces sp. NPDC001568 TaxID=3364588 RepID=UPI00369F6DCE
MSVDEAIRDLERSHDRLIDRYLALEERARTLPDLHGLPEQAPPLVRYLSTLRSWISGNNAWSRETLRYNDRLPAPR